MTPDEAAAVLGVAVGAGRAEIDAAYRRAARASHPDLTGNTDAFVRATEARDLLNAIAPPDAAAPPQGQPPLSRPLLITWTLLMLLAIGVSLGATTFPLTPFEPIARYGLLLVGSIGYAVTGRRIYLVLAVIAIAATAVVTVLYTNFGALVGMLLLVAPLYGLLVTRARLRRV